MLVGNPRSPLWVIHILQNLQIASGHDYNIVLPLILMWLSHVSTTKHPWNIVRMMVARWTKHKWTLAGDGGQVNKTQVNSVRMTVVWSTKHLNQIRIYSAGLVYNAIMFYAVRSFVPSFRIFCCCWNNNRKWRKIVKHRNQLKSHINWTITITFLI